jgi:hypothetical protein
MTKLRIFTVLYLIIILILSCQIAFAGNLTDDQAHVRRLSGKSDVVVAYGSGNKGDKAMSYLNSHGIQAVWIGSVMNSLLVPREDGERACRLINAMYPSDDLFYVMRYPVRLDSYGLPESIKLRSIINQNIPINMSRREAEKVLRKRGFVIWNDPSLFGMTGRVGNTGYSVLNVAKNYDVKGDWKTIGSLTFKNNRYISVMIGSCYISSRSALVRSIHAMSNSRR